MCAAIFASSVSIVRGQYEPFDSTFTTAQAGDGPPDDETTGSASSSGKIPAPAKISDTGSQVPIYQPVSAHGTAKASVTGHSISIEATAQVMGPSYESFGSASAAAHAGFTLTVHLHNATNTLQNGHWNIKLAYKMKGPNATANFYGSIAAIDARGNQVDSQDWGSSPTTGVGTNNVIVTGPPGGFFEGDTEVLTEYSEVYANADAGNQYSSANLAHTVWFQFVADDPSTLSAVGDDGWDYSTPYTSTPDVAIAPTFEACGIYNGQFEFIVDGSFSTNYIVQATTDLTSTNWIPLITNSAPFIFTDTETNLYTQRFYRGVVAP